jgi:Rad3-related DNA helicase
MRLASDSDTSKHAHVSVLSVNYSCIHACIYVRTRTRSNIPLLPAKHNHQDIEEIAELGKSQHACAYYASRGAVASAQLIALPYSMLLHKDTRETLGIDLKGAVVICDEAHNLLDSLSDLHSAELSLAQVCTN